MLVGKNKLISTYLQLIQDINYCEHVFKKPCDCFYKVIVIVYGTDGYLLYIYLHYKDV